MLKLITTVLRAGVTVLVYDNMKIKNKINSDLTH